MIEKNLKKAIIRSLKKVLDPELGVSVYDLGLIYQIKTDNKNNVQIKMTLTVPGCPFMENLKEEVAAAARKAGANLVRVDLVFDPPWRPEMMTEEGRKKLGW